MPFLIFSTIIKNKHQRLSRAHHCHPEIKVSSGEIQAQVIKEIIKFTLSLTFDSNEIPERNSKGPNTQNN
jgi:hypothetical protein